MRLHLPPGVSAAQFDAGLAAFRGAVGDDWVLATDLDRDTYADYYAPGDQEAHAPGAAVAPASVEETQAILRLANEHRIPLWPVSRGKNLGYGAAAPRVPGTVVLDMGRMRRILEVNEDLAYCVVEPGVSFFDLYEHLRANEIPLWMSVPGNAWGSVMGNALDHGFGYTPYGFHARNVCGLEVVLPTGDLVRTNMGAMPGNHSWHVYPLSYGPSFDHMFSQSNMGVVTKMGYWLQPEPAHSISLSMQAPEDSDIGWIVDTISPMRRNGLIDQNQFVSSSLGRLVLMGQRSDFYDGEGAMPEEVANRIRREHDLGFWAVNIRLYGEEAVNRAKADVIKAAFARHTDTAFAETQWSRGEPVEAMDPGFGVPTAVPLQMANWTGGRGAHLGFSPVVPATSEHVLRQLERSRRVIAAHDVDFYASFTIGERFCTNINMLMYDRDNDAQVANIRRLFDALIADAREAGYGEYRTHLSWMDPVADTYDFNDHAQRRMAEAIKDALDPNGILAPGKQGVWPERYRDRRGSEA